jgi:hypothetical protein
MGRGTLGAADARGIDPRRRGVGARIILPSLPCLDTAHEENWRSIRGAPRTFVSVEEAPGYVPARYAAWIAAADDRVPAGPFFADIPHQAIIDAINDLASRADSYDCRVLPDELPADPRLVRTWIGELTPQLQASTGAGSRWWDRRRYRNKPVIAPPVNRTVMVRNPLTYTLDVPIGYDPEQRGGDSSPIPATFTRLPDDGCWAVVVNDEREFSSPEVLYESSVRRQTACN